MKLAIGIIGGVAALFAVLFLVFKLVKPGPKAATTPAAALTPAPPPPASATDKAAQRLSAVAGGASSLLAAAGGVEGIKNLFAKA